jgi:dCMP deaminase
MQNVPNWDQYFFEFAKTASLRSNCLRAHVGAVVVDRDKRIVASGYNGTPSGIKSCMERGTCYRVQNNIPSGTQYETCRSIHAEANAIIQAGRALCKGSTLYVYGHSLICVMCQRMIINAGIEKVCLLTSSESTTMAVLYPKWDFNL